MNGHICRWKRARIKDIVAKVREDNAPLVSGVEAAPLTNEETLHLTSVTTVEIFGPSTFHQLGEAIKRLPLSTEVQHDIQRNLAAARRDSRIVGPIGLCTALPPDEKLWRSDTFHDDSLPTGIASVTIKAHTLAPSVTLLTCTFRINAAAGDLSAIQRSEHAGEITNIRVIPKGLLSEHRSKLEWARPRNPTVKCSLTKASGVRENQCAAVISAIEQACAEWTTRRFPGQMGSLQFDSRPIGRAFALGGYSWTDRNKIPDALGIWYVSGSRANEIWATENALDWVVITDGLLPKRPCTVTACRKFDTLGQAVGDPHLRSVMMGFDSHFEDFLARWTLIHSMAQYRHEMADLRDSFAGNTDRLEGAMRLSDYLISAGMNTTTLATEIAEGGDLPIFVDHLKQRMLGKSAPSNADGPPILEAVQEIVRRDAHQLLLEYRSATSALTSHAQLHQSTTNTALQIRMYRYAIRAVIISLIGLSISIAGIAIAYRQLENDLSTPSDRSPAATPQAPDAAEPSGQPPPVATPQGPKDTEPSGQPPPGAKPQDPKRTEPSEQPPPKTAR